jgi:hypothetical protein
MYFSSVRRASFFPAVFIQPLRIPIGILPVMKGEAEISDYRQRTQPGIPVRSGIFKYTYRLNVCTVPKSYYFPKNLLILTRPSPDPVLPDHFFK